MAYGAILGQKGVSSFNGRSGVVVPQSGDYTADMVNAAPAGYGLGGNAVAMSGNDLDNITATGWYVGAPSLPSPFDIGNSIVYHINYDTSAIQTAYLLATTTGPSYKGTSMQRVKEGGTWGEWEWINPPTL